MNKNNTLHITHTPTLTHPDPSQRHPNTPPQTPPPHTPKHLPLIIVTPLKDWLLDDSLHETFEIRNFFFLINLIDFNPLHTFRQSFTGISPLKYVFLPFFISKHISLFLFIANKHVICKTGQI